MTKNIVKPRIFRDVVIIGSGMKQLWLWMNVNIWSLLTCIISSLTCVCRTFGMHCGVSRQSCTLCASFKYYQSTRYFTNALSLRIYAGRALLNPLVIAGYNAGGQLMLTSDVENFPGYPTGKSGPDMMNDLMGQAKRFGAEFWQTDCDNIDTSCRPFQISTDNCTVVAKSVIVATGAESIWLNAIDEEKFKGSDLSTCATCDGFLSRDKEVVVIDGRGLFPDSFCPPRESDSSLG